MKGILIRFVYYRVSVFTISVAFSMVAYIVARVFFNLANWTMAKNKGSIPVKGYFARAKVFGYIVLATIIFAVLYYAYKFLMG